MKQRHFVAALATPCLLIALNGGCLSLSLFNKDSSDMKARLDALDARVSALEANNPHGPTPPVVVPTPTAQLPASTAGPKTRF